jgi:hypothetical protein
MRLGEFETTSPSIRTARLDDAGLRRGGHVRSIYDLTCDDIWLNNLFLVDLYLAWLRARQPFGRGLS